MTKEGKGVNFKQFVNKDGYADIIVGASGNDTNGNGSGSATVFSGATGEPLYTFYGKNSSDVFGYSVSAAGDVNNDGYVDVIIGAKYSSTNGSSSGSAAIYSGANGLLLYTFSGTSVQEVNQLMKQFDQMSKMMKMMQGGGGRKMMQMMQGMKG